MNTKPSVLVRPEVGELWTTAAPKRQVFNGPTGLGTGSHQRKGVEAHTRSMEASLLEPCCARTSSLAWRRSR